jgi:hypothetical protein
MKPLFAEGGKPVSASTVLLIEQHREATRNDVVPQARACALLEADTAALGNEGHVAHSPSPKLLVATLEQAHLANDAGPRRWTIVTNRKSTHVMLEEADALAAIERDGTAYMGFFADEL